MNNGVKAASNTTGLGSNDSPDSQSPLVDPGTNESENSNIQTDQSAVPDSKSSEAQDAENAYFALKLRKFNPMGIVDPKESVMQNEMQLWKKTRDQLKLKLLQDLELFKEWRPVEPFSKMLVKALERDTKWRESGDYANMDMQSLIRNAISVPIFMKRGYMFRSKGYISRVEYEWK
jgi:hypothetical protein